MSTKIYDAYRAAPGIPLWPLMRDLKARGQVEAKIALTVFYERLIAELSGLSSMDYRGALAMFEGDDRKARLYLVHNQVRSEYQKQLSSSCRNEFDLKVTIAVRELDDRLYLRAHCDMTMANTLDFMRTFPCLEDYSYWNNADKPRGVSARKWEERRVTWDRLCAAGWSNSLTLEIVSHPIFHEVDPYADMMTPKGGEAAE